MANNIGTLVTSAIRPNSPLDTIASAYASEIKGGLHTATASTDRDSIIIERREWGMMCYVINDTKTYQLEYSYSSTNIMDNSNWVEFSGSGGGSGNEWLDSVISVTYSQPLSPVSGQRYLAGTKYTDVITGSQWGLLTSGFVAEWNSSLSTWDITTPTDGMSIRVDNEDNSIYRYEGIYNSGGQWEKELLGQVRYLDVTSVNGLSYSVTIDPPIDIYQREMVYLAKFDTINTGLTASLNINGMGDVLIKKPTSSGLSNVFPGDIELDFTYNLTYDGTYFQINRPYINESLFSIKYYIEPGDYVVIPQYFQYWVYGDLTIAGNLTNYGHLLISNGGLVISGGTFSNYGSLSFLSFNTGVTTSYNNSDTIGFTVNNTINGASVSSYVLPNSLTASVLNSIGGATAGYLLSVDGSGIFNWVTSPSVGGLVNSSDKNFIMLFDTNGDGQFTGLTLSSSPLSSSYISVYVNGQEFEVGNGTTSNVSCYFSGDSGLTARDFLGINSPQSGDGLFWNGIYVGTDLYTNWRISTSYLI